MGVRCGGVIILGATCQSSIPLQLIIATCRVFRHLRTTEEADNPRRELAFSNFVEVIGENSGCPRIQRREMFRREATQLSLHAEESVAGKLTCMEYLSNPHSIRRAGPIVRREFRG